MVKPKQQQHQQKLKPKKNPIVKKKQGKQEDIAQFRAQLDALGLKIVQLTADGNCFFRGLADQLEGNEEQHGKYRAMVVQYLVKNKEMFEPFIEDDVPFDEYCESMETDGTWAGHMELQAASLVTRSNICIHRCMSPRWYIRNFNQSGARMIHLSYHDEEHYNSVRSKEDPCDGPSKPITIKADADLSAASHQAKTISGKSKGGTSWDDIDTGSIKLVMAGTGCDNTEKVKKVLQQVDGDVDVAIEFLVAEQEADDYLAENDSVHCLAETSHGQHDHEDGRNEQQKEEPPKNAKNDAPSSFSGTKQTCHNGSSPADGKKISRNQACPCGSKKKYKACCGTIKGRSKFTVTVDPKKNRKETKQRKKGQAAESEGACGSDVGLPDMGALCI